MSARLIELLITALVVVVSNIGGLLWFASKLDRTMERFLVEHEILVGDYCTRHKLKTDDLPTRVKSVWGSRGK